MFKGNNLIFFIIEFMSLLTIFKPLMFGRYWKHLSPDEIKILMEAVCKISELLTPRNVN
jgi:hypothetical protein